MKKNIVIAGACTALATVLASAPAFASDPVKLSVGGSGIVMMGYASQDDDYTGATGTEVTGVDMKGDNTITFSGETTLDNGLNIAVDYELEAGGRDNDDIDDVYSITVSGGFGSIIAGADGTALSKIATGAPSVTDTLDEGDVADGLYVMIPNESNYSLLDATWINTSGDSESLSYISPAVMGFTLGATYVPDVNGDDDASQPSATAGNAGSNEGYGVGLTWSGEFNSVGITAEGGYLWADAGPNATGVTTSYASGREEWQAGVQLTYAGFAFGGAYRDVAQDMKMPTGTTGIRSTMDGSVWELGASYETGPYAVSLSYMENSMENTATNVSDDEGKIWELAGKYALGPGVDLIGTVGHAEFENGTASGASQTVVDSNHNEGWIVASGLSLSF